MDRYTETSETWNKLAALYQDMFMDLDLYDETYDFVCSSVDKKNAKILDMGCGPGNITKYLLSIRPDFDIFGIDNAPNMIELAKRNNPNARFAVIDCRHMDEINTKYDAVVCGFCLPYLSHSDSEKCITDCYNLLNEDGLLYISFVEGDPNASGFQMGSTGDRSYFYFYDLNALTTQLLENGFGEFKLYTVDYKKNETDTEMHTIVIARKITSD